MISDLHRQLVQWESDQSLFDPQHVRERFEVLDQLDGYFGHPESQPPMRDDPGAGIFGRAASLRVRLESANSAICASVRGQVQQGTRPAELLRHLPSPGWPRPIPGLGYDYLDEFVSGIMQLRAPQETHSAPEPEMVFYQPTPARHILHLIAIAAFSPSDILVDVGSGLGHVPLLVSILTGIHTVGIEVDASFIASARDCARSLNLDRVAFLHEDARTANLSRGTVFYLYTPFTGALLRAVLERLREQAATSSIRIATLGPCATVVAKERWLDPTTPSDPDRITLFQSCV